MAGHVLCGDRPALAPECTAVLKQNCSWTFSIQNKTERQRSCSECVQRMEREISQVPARAGCPVNHTAGHIYAQMIMEQDYCDHGKKNSRNVRSFPPFSSPQKLGMHCSCINGSTYDCEPAFDDGNHGHPFVPAGGFCDFDVFAGGLWSQWLKAHLLNNGIAVAEINNYIQDGWTSWADEWDGGYDVPFFAKLAKAMRPQSAGVLSKLDPNRVAFRGWSGSAQMVSWLMNQAAYGKLPGLSIGAGIMMAGGSHACYNWPGHGARNQCANCTSTSTGEE